MISPQQLQKVNYVFFNSILHFFKINDSKKVSKSIIWNYMKLFMNTMQYDMYTEYMFEILWVMKHFLGGRSEYVCNLSLSCLSYNAAQNRWVLSNLFFVVNLISILCFFDVLGKVEVFNLKYIELWIEPGSLGCFRAAALAFKL